jgi:hypothetical protein
MGSVMDGQDDTSTGSNAENQLERIQADRLERLDDVLDIYGAQYADWPEAVRLEFPRDDLAQPAFAQRIEEERAFAHLLNMDTAPSPTASLRASILASAPSATNAKATQQPLKRAAVVPKSRVRVWVETLWSDGANLIPAGALAASIMGGVILGSTGVTGNLATTTTDPTEELMTLAFADTQYSGDW